MNGAPTTEPTAEAVEHALRDELARGDAMIAGARPILRHLLAEPDRALFSEELVARVRGMLLDVARQLLFAQAEAAEAPDPAAHVTDHQGLLAAAFAQDEGLLGHAQALIIEARLAERLRTQLGLDPVLSPLIQELAADADATIAGEAMTVLAAQARFMQHYRRMELPLRELPGELLHKALLALRDRGADAGIVERMERRLRDSYNEGSGRAAALARLVLACGQPAARALDVERAGVAIFATALALGSGQDRDRTALSLTDHQLPRLALVLRVSGLASREVDRQLLLFHPHRPLPGEFNAIPADRAAAILAASTAPEAASVD